MCFLFFYTLLRSEVLDSSLPDHYFDVLIESRVLEKEEVLLSGGKKGVFFDLLSLLVFFHLQKKRRTSCELEGEKGGGKGKRKKNLLEEKINL